MLSICLRATWIFLIISLLNRFVVAKSSDTRVVCYYTNWSVYRSGSAKFTPQNINPYLCTHLVYAFGGFTKDGALKPFDKYQDIDKGGYAKFTGLKTYNKHLKTMIAIGGWNEGSSKFSGMSASAEKRANFTKNVVRFLRQNSFDGLDLDWEYPAAREGGKPRDKENYATLVKELREEFDRESGKTGRSRLLLTMAVPAGTNHIEKGYNIPKLNQYLDWFNILSYDYHSSHESLINHHAPLKSLEEDNEYSLDAGLNIDFSIDYYLREGADPDKIVLGIPTYGRSYTLVNPDATDIGSPAEGPGEKGEFTKEKGYLAYYEICHRVKDDDWTVVDVDPEAVGPFAFKDDQWVGYDDEEIVRKKSRYVVERGLGGIMFWSIDNDDFRGDCHGKPFPIIEAAKEALLEALGIDEITYEEEPEKPSKSKSKGVVRQKVTSKPEVSQRTTSSPKPTQPKVASPRPKTRATTPRPPSDDHKTTPSPPTTPSTEADFTCEDEGFFPNPKDCKKYFWCLDGGASGLGLVAHQFTCPSGLYFNPAADSCDYTRNVLCKKQATTTTTTTTPLPTTTSTTQRTTTAARSTQSSIVTRNNLFRNTRTSTPRTTAATTRTTTTTTTTTTPSTTPATILDEEVDGEEDPRIIKELIGLIKKAGGLEQLEKQFHLRSSDDTSAEKPSEAPATVNKSLYQRVLNKALALSQNKREYGTISRSTTVAPVTTTTTTTTLRPRSVITEETFEISKPSYTSLNRNSRPKPQNDGIDKLPEFEGTLREKPKYVTLVRPKAEGTNIAEEEVEYSYEIVSAEDDDDEDQSDLLEPARPTYVDTNRLRALKQDVNVEEINNAATEEPATSNRYINIQRQKFTTSEEVTTGKYKTIERSRPTKPAESSEEVDTTVIISRPTPSTKEVDTAESNSDRYRLVGESSEIDDETTLKPFYTRSTTRAPESDEVSQKETVFIITRPSTRQLDYTRATKRYESTTQSAAARRRSSTERTTQARTTQAELETRPTRTRGPLRGRSTTTPTTTQREDETTIPVRTRVTRPRNRYSRPNRPENEEIQSSTVYAPRPFIGSRTTERIDRQDTEYRPRGRGTARFSRPTPARNVNFENPRNANTIRRRGPSRAFAEEDNDIDREDEEQQTTPEERQQKPTRSRLRASAKQDEGPLNFLVPDRAVNPNSKFTLTSGFSSGRRDTTPKAVVEEDFDINTANPNVLSRNQYGELSSQLFPSVADIKEDTVILTLGGQLAVASPAQTSLQNRINEELSKLVNLDTVAPYSVTISSLAPEDEFDDDSHIPTRLASVGTTKLTRLRTTIAPETTARTMNRKPTTTGDFEEEEITQTIARLLSSGVPSSYTPERYSTISDYFTTELPTEESQTVLPTTASTTQSPRSRKIKKIKRTRPTIPTAEAEESKPVETTHARRRPASRETTTTTTQSPIRTRGTVRRLVRKRPVTTTTVRTTTPDELEEEEEDLDINIDNNIQRQSTGRFADPSEFSRPTRRFQPSTKNDVQVEKESIEVRPTRNRFLLRTTTVATPEEEDIQLNFAVPDEDILNSVTSVKPRTRPSLRPVNRFSLKPKPTDEEKNTVRISTTRRPPAYRSKPTFSRTTASTEASISATKKANLFSRTRNRNYVNRFRNDEKKEIDNEIEKSTESAVVDETTYKEAATTMIPTTTLKHVFAIEETTNPSEPSDGAEEISKKLEKLVEINIIEEINTRVEKHKLRNKSKEEVSNMTEVVFEKLPTNHKVGEISRLAVIKYLNGDDDKKSRILSSDAIFKTETSTIPLERLFELERQAKELRDSSTISPTVTPIYVHEPDITFETTTLDEQQEGTTIDSTNNNNEIKTQSPLIAVSLTNVQTNGTAAPLISSGYSQTTK